MLRVIVRLALAVLCVSGSYSHAAAKIGEPAPDIVLGSTQDGHTARASDYSGKVVVISFWASWCSPCRKELATLEGLQSEAKGSLQVIAVNIEDREIFKKAVKQFADLHVLLVNDRNDRAQSTYEVKAIPHMVIVDTEGRILSMHKGYGEDGLAGIVDEIRRALSAGSTNHG